MANYGNTGQRYKMAKRESYFIRPDGGVVFQLSCGHSEPHGVPQFTPWTPKEAEEWIGKRTRCNQCKA